VKTDCFFQGLDWLTLKEVEEEEGGGGTTPAPPGPWAGTVGAGGGDCRSWGRGGRNGDGRSRGRGRGRRRH